MNGTVAEEIRFDKDTRETRWKKYRKILGIVFVKIIGAVGLASVLYAYRYVKVYLACDLKFIPCSYSYRWRAVTRIRYDRYCE